MNHSFFPALWITPARGISSAHTRCMDGSQRSALREFVDDETGDVPGWVLVTLMTAGLVVAIWTLAGPALAALFEQALSRVSGL